MSKKHSLLLCYGLVISILLLIAGFLGLGIRAFASASISSSIMFAAFGILVVTVPVYFVLRRPATVTATIDQTISGGALHKTPAGKDRRKPLLQGQEKVAVAIERRGRGRGALLVVSQEPVAGETLRG
jgi:hypothetical protein